MNKNYKVFTSFFCGLLLLVLSGCMGTEFFELGQTFKLAQGNIPVSISENGSRIVVRDGAYIRVYEYNENATSNDNVWVQLGNVIISSDGFDVPLSGDGTIVAVAGTTVLRVYQYDGSLWSQLGGDLLAPARIMSVSVNRDGTIVAYGSYNSNTNTSIARVYQYASGSWSQLGSDLIGNSVSINATGTRMAIGNSPINDNVKIYQYVSGSWSEIGNISGDTSSNFGASVSLEYLTGDLVAIGASAFSENSNYAEVYKYAGSGQWNLFGERMKGDLLFGLSVSLSLQTNNANSSYYQLIVGSYEQTFIYNKLTLPASGTWNVLQTIAKRGRFLSSSQTINESTPTKTKRFSRFIRGGSDINGLINSSGLASDAQVYTSEEVTLPASVASTAKPEPVNLAKKNNPGGKQQVAIDSLGISTPAGINPIVALMNAKAVTSTQLSQQTFVYDGDSGETFFLISTPSSSYNNKLFKCSNLQGTLSFIINSYHFTQTGSVVGAVYEDDKTTVVEADVTLTNGEFNNVQLTGTFDPATNVLTVTDITGGVITSGTFTTSGIPTLTLVSDVPVNTFNITSGDFSGSTFATSGIAGTLSGGTLSSGNTVLTGTTITQSNTVTGVLTIPSGLYAGDYYSVNLTGATFSSATVTGTFASNTFSGTDVTVGNISAGTFDALFVTLGDTTPNLSFTISGGDFDTGTFTVTSGTFISRYVDGTGTVTSTTLTGVSLDQIGSVIGTITHGADTFTGVELAGAELTGVNATGTSTDNFFTATDVTSSTFSNGAATLFFTYLLVSDTTSFAFPIASGMYAGETFTISGLSGTLSQNGTLNPTYTTYTGATQLLASGCYNGTLSTSGQAVLNPSLGFIFIEISSPTVTGTLTGLTFNGSDVVGGTITSGDFTTGGSCS
ncbi:MAG: hypothetical protein WC747_03425 [Candidatus Babeliales bacterium]